MPATRQRLTFPEARIAALEARFVPRFRAAVRGAAASCRAKVSTSALRDALARRDVEAALRAVPLDRFAAALAPAFQRTFLMAMAASGREASAAVRLRKAKSKALLAPVKPGKVPAAAFALNNPRAIEAARTYTYNLVTRVTDETRAAIRRVIVAGQQGKLTIDQQADRIRETIGLNEQQSVAAMNFDLGLRADGDLTDEQIAQRVGRMVDKSLDYRAEMIARTETARAQSAGQWESWQQAADDGLIGRDAQRVWIAENDACPLCDALDGTVVGIDEPWIAGDGEALMYAPKHPSCRCAMGIVDPGTYTPGEERSTDWLGDDLLATEEN